MVGVSVVYKRKNPDNNLELLCIISRFAVIIGVNMDSSTYWDVLPRSLVVGYRRFGETYFFHL
jgi:hypothetical protein